MRFLERLVYVSRFCAVRVVNDLLKLLISSGQRAKTRAKKTGFLFLYLLKDQIQFLSSEMTPW